MVHESHHKISCLLQPDLQLLVGVNLFFFYFLIETYVVGAQKNRLIETVLLSTQNLCID